MSRSDQVNPRLGHCNQSSNFHGRALSLISLLKGWFPNPAMMPCWLARVRATDDFLFVMSPSLPLPYYHPSKVSMDLLILVIFPSYQLYNVPHFIFFYNFDTFIYSYYFSYRIIFFYYILIKKFILYLCF